VSVGFVMSTNLLLCPPSVVELPKLLGVLCKGRLLGCAVSGVSCIVGGSSISVVTAVLCFFPLGFGGDVRLSITGWTRRSQRNASSLGTYFCQPLTSSLPIAWFHVFGIGNHM
jgi:hypothetical protein